MAVPVIESWQSAQATSFPSSITITKPSGVVAGDLLLICLSDDYNADGLFQYDDSTNKPSGFSLVTRWNAGTAPDQTNGAIFSKVADGGEGSTFNVPCRSTNHYGIVGWCLRISGHGETAGSAHKIGTYSSVSSTAFNITGVTTTVDDCLCLYLHATAGGDQAPYSVAGPWTELDEQSTTATASSASGSIGSRSLATAGASGNAAITSTSAPTNYNNGIQIALQPASGAAVTGVNLVDITGAAHGALSSLKWSWFDTQDPNSMVAPTDQGAAEVTTAGGVLDLDLPNSTLTSGQTGTLVLRDAANNYIGAYHLQVD